MALPAFASSVYASATMCALVLEDEPTNRLTFESFPEQGIEESYAVSGYEEIAGKRAGQPGRVAYRGGNWSSFTLELKFRAGNSLGRVANIDQIAALNLDEVLREMERKVRWCQALYFPKRRSARALQERVERAALAIGMGRPDIAAVNLGQLERTDPPFVLVQFGSFLTLRCYATSYNIKWEHPFHPLTARPYGALVSLSLQRYDGVDKYPTWDSIAGDIPFAQSDDLSARLNTQDLISRSVAETTATSRAATNGLAITGALFAATTAAAAVSVRR